MPYFEFMMLIDDWIEEIEEKNKAERKRQEEMERERKKADAARKRSQYKHKTPSMPKNLKPKFK